MKRKNANATGFIIIIALLGLIAYLVTRPPRSYKSPLPSPFPTAYPRKNASAQTTTGI